MTARLSGTATLLSPDSSLAQALSEDEALDTLMIGLLRTARTLTRARYARQ